MDKIKFLEDDVHYFTNYFSNNFGKIPCQLLQYLQFFCSSNDIYNEKYNLVHTFQFHHIS